MIAWWLFWGVASLALTALWLFFAFRRNERNTAIPPEREDVNLALYRRRLAELVAEQEEPCDSSLEDELDAALLADVDDGKNTHHVAGSAAARRTHIGLALAIPLVAGVLYWYAWGEPEATVLARIPAMLSNGGTQESRHMAEQVLLEQVAVDPGDADSWLYLISLQGLMRKHEAVMATHQLAEALGHTSPLADVEYLLAAFAVRQLRFNERDQRVIGRVESDQPEHPQLLQLKLFEAVARESWPAAKGLSERILRQELHSDTRTFIDALAREVEKQLAMNGQPRVTVDVQLHHLPPDAKWMTLMAKGRDQSEPLAVVRRPLERAFNSTFVLDDSQAMLGTHKLSDTTEVQVTLRLSASSGAVKEPGDVLVVSEWVNPQRQPNMSLEFGEVGGQTQRSLTVRVSSAVELSSSTPIFVILRRKGTSGPPLAVKRATAGELPVTLRVSQLDSMVGLPIPFGTEPLSVLVRAAVSGDAKRRLGDFESAAVDVPPSMQVDLLIDEEVTDSGT